MGSGAVSVSRDLARQARVIASRDTVRAGQLGGVVLAGLAVLWLWGLYAELFLSNFVVVSVSTVLTAAYAGVIAVLIGNLVRAEDRWQVESAHTLRDLLSERADRTSSVQSGTAFYVRQLHLRLADEVRRCQEYGTPLSVVAVRLEAVGQSPTHALLTQANAAVSDLVSAHPDAFVCPTPLGLFEYAFILPHQDRQVAAVMTEFVAGALGRFHCSFGVATFPEDGGSAEALLREANDRCGILHSSAA